MADASSVYTVHGYTYQSVHYLCQYQVIQDIRDNTFVLSIKIAKDCVILFGNEVLE